MLGNILSVIIFSLIAQHLYAVSAFFAHMDIRMQQFFARFPFWEVLMPQIYRLFTIQGIGILGLIIIVYLYRKRLLYHLTVFISSMLSTLLLFPIVKVLLQRSSPDPSFLPLNDFNFPSGYAMMSLVVCLLCWYVFHGQIKALRMRHVLLAIMMVSALGIGMSRMVLYSY
ncbi:MAG: hypothetical protein LBP53_08910 [Candidatus Peribacteria bacterium]|jgi:hypothetical protein|nr:hypothetical protein [Candidatus Peribacteria bacterium]